MEPAGTWRIVYIEEENILYWADCRAAMAEQKSLVPARKNNGQTKEGPLSFVLFESPFASFSTVSWGHPLSILSGANKGKI